MPIESVAVDGIEAFIAPYPGYEGLLDELHLPTAAGAGERFRIEIVLEGEPRCGTRGDPGRVVCWHLASRRWKHREPDRRYRPAVHREVEVACVHRGLARYRSGRREVSAQAGSWVLVPAGVEHATELCRGLDATAFELPHQTIERTRAATRRRLGPDLRVFEATPGLCALRTLIESELTRQDPGRDLAIDGLVDALGVELLRVVGVEDEHPRANPQIRRAVTLIHDAYERPLTVAVLAKEAAMSRYHFSRTFRQQVGASPYQYLLRVRVDRASELLRRGTSVSAAAYTVGFNDLGRFARAFRSVHGCLPSELASPAR